MNPSDWIKAAALITQQKQEAATADANQLSSMPLSELAMDDSGPPVVHYGMHMPTATSTPTHVEMDTYTLQQEDTYQQIIPGIPQGSLYPTLAHLDLKKELLQKKHKHFTISIQRFGEIFARCRTMSSSRSHLL